MFAPAVISNMMSVNLNAKIIFKVKLKVVIYKLSVTSVLCGVRGHVRVNEVHSHDRCWWFRALVV